MVRPLITASVVLFIAAASAPASIFYGVTSAGNLTRFDTAAQTVTTVGPIHIGPTNLTSFFDIEADGAGNIYAIRNFTDFNPFPPIQTNTLYRFNNLATASVVIAANLGNTGTPFQSLAFRPSTGQFYSVNALNGQLGTLATNGVFTSVSGVPNGIRNTVGALAINPVDGLAWGIIDAGIPAPFGTSNYSLISMNLTTGLSTVVGSLGVGTDPFTALRFDDAGTAFTVNTINGNVYTVNTSTGAASFLFAGGAAAVNTQGLVFVPAPRSRRRARGSPHAGIASPPEMTVLYRLGPWRRPERNTVSKCP